MLFILSGQSHALVNRNALIEGIVLSNRVGAERLDLLVQICRLSAGTKRRSLRRKSTVLNESMTERSLSGE